MFLNQKNPKALDALKALKDSLSEDDYKRYEKEIQEIAEIIERYEKDGKYLGESLNYNALNKGYAIHNAGLLPAQKELIEELFNKKLVKELSSLKNLEAFNDAIASLENTEDLEKITGNSFLGFQGER